MDYLRTPKERFEGLEGYPFSPHYTEVTANDGTALRLHYLDEGPKNGEVILCLHGQPSWSYLYRKMIPLLMVEGYRVIAPDLIGFGKSDKPIAVEDYSYQGHVDWMCQWLLALDLNNITLVCQDWGGLIGLRMVATFPDRFARLVIANTGLPDSKAVKPELSEMLGNIYPTLPVPSAQHVQQKFKEGDPTAFLCWVKYASEHPNFTVKDVFKIMSKFEDDKALEGYDAPFPNDQYQAGARAFPALVPLLPHHKSEREENDKAWTVLKQFDRPVLTAFSDRDPVTKGGEAVFQKRIPGAKSIEHVTIQGGGHFLQEDSGLSLSEAIINFMRATPLTR
ncbi:MAG: haloalkane dehalogenase [Pseudomonadota bacterium]